MSWASTYLVEVRHITAENAALFASLFYIGITVGRFISGVVSNKLGDRKMIIIGTCVILCGVIVLLLPLGEISALVGLVTMGLGCAPVYPSIIHSTPRNFGAENSGAIIGIQMASAYVGSTFMPPIYGFLGSKLGFGIFPIYLTIFALLMITMTELTFRLTSKKEQ